jgi:hypothetical protein
MCRGRGGVDRSHRVPESQVWATMLLRPLGGEDIPGAVVSFDGGWRWSDVRLGCSGV